MEIIIALTLMALLGAPVASEKIAGVDVTIYKTDSPPTGLTFLLTGAMIPLSEYTSTKGVLLEQNQWVVGIHINVLWPPGLNNHRTKAQKISEIFDVLKEEYSNLLPDMYNIVGHSVGGQISLLAAAAYDATRVGVVIALDPVDQLPSFFTDQKRPNESLANSASSVTLTLTDGGPGISKDHNAQAIQNRNPSAVLVRHYDAGHMAYTDDGGGIFGKLTPGGTPEGNKAAREDAHQLIREHINIPVYA